MGTKWNGTNDKLVTFHLTVVKKIINLQMCYFFLQFLCHLTYTYTSLYFCMYINIKYILSFAKLLCFFWMSDPINIPPKHISPHWCICICLIILIPYIDIQTFTCQFKIKAWVIFIFAALILICLVSVFLKRTWNIYCSVCFQPISFSF